MNFMHKQCLLYHHHHVSVNTDKEKNTCPCNFSGTASTLNAMGVHSTYTLKT